MTGVHAQPFPRVESVIKIGGSLLGCPDLPVRLANFLADFSRHRVILLCGGGPVVDLIREWDRTYGLDEEFCHWTAVRALTLNSRVLEAAMPQLVRVSSPGELEDVWAAEKSPLYDAFAFLSEIDARRADPLPRRWRCTSDSIAARLAVVSAADELVLLKSQSVNPGCDLESAAREGVVDPHFPTAAVEIRRVACVNLREDEPKEVDIGSVQV